MKDQLHKAWRTNNKINLLFIELIDDEDMNKTLSTRSGKNGLRAVGSIVATKMSQLIKLTGVKKLS